MKRYQCGGLLVCAGLALCSLGGCGERAGEAQENIYEGLVSMEEEPVIAYQKPELTPNILVDLQGYYPSDEKTAAVKGSRLPGQFRLLEASTGLEVYSGKLEDTVYDEEQGLYLGYADFSAIGQEGVYYLECGGAGQSYRFSITEELYSGLFEAAYLLLEEGCDKKELSVREAIELLEAYEWYGSLFPLQEDKSPRVLEKLKGWTAAMEEKETEQGALYAAFLAKFGYNYQKIDLQYATDCLKRASTVYGQVQAPEGGSGECFFALTELYRATSLSTYRNEILKYGDILEERENCLDETFYLYGSMTYLMTRQKVDMDLCRVLMNHIMDRGEKISKEYEAELYPLESSGGKLPEALENAVELSCANFVLNNYQYTNIIEDYLHYLMGRNLESVDFFEEGQDRGSYLLLLAQLASNHQKNDEQK